MRLLKLFTSAFIFLLFAAPHPLWSQVGQWVLKEIVHGPYNTKMRKPDLVNVNANEGRVEFTIPHKQDCSEKYQLSYRFHQDMNTLSVLPDAGQPPEYSYEFTFKPLGRPCYPMDDYRFRNPWAKAATDAAGSSTPLKGRMLKEGTWKYGKGNDFLGERSETYYAHAPSTAYKTGTHNGVFKVTGPRAKDVKYYLDNYGNVYTELYFLLQGSSSLDGDENAFSYDVVFVYQLTDGTGQVDNCEIKAPDCSCCPGTIPVWNFATNKGDCLCPEGKIWDKVGNQCVDAGK